ncbi:GNAT family N-acetyltransferase [Streptomyces sp. NBC_00829]|uniref:GNAT family N-acetyltransferase n=1 Tax=Streptomyces sp. NBC_00829 TaxID=2903679 RepID=UPI003865BCE5|nr:GNAT family N-acetyltransferase [Streptomyces sp. NBC_00829]
MTWHLTHDVGTFRRAAHPCLTRDPARCTVLLTVSETLRRHGPRAFGGSQDARFGWYEEAGGAEGAFVQTPPLPPSLGPMGHTLARSLALALRDAGVELGGVRGEQGDVQAFAEAWAPHGWTVGARHRLFRLGALTPQRPAPPGRARRAGPADVPLVAAWMRGFAADIGSDAGVDHTENITRRVADGCLFLWEADGQPVSMAARSPLLAGQSRISAVYTPAALRGRGYAGAVTAAVSGDALEAGAEQVLLFTDLANPTSNALYRRLGYRPLADHLALDFD